jgi:hypothetical protein
MPEIITRTAAETALLDDPIDIIALGRGVSEAQAAHPSVTTVAFQCDFVDCDRWVLVSGYVDMMAYDVYDWRTHEDDTLLFCCSDHAEHINNAPAIIGIDAIEDAHAALMAHLGLVDGEDSSESYNG